MAESSLPIDRGWAWVILAGAFMINVVSLGCVKSFGLLYAKFLDYFQAGAGETAWVFSLTIFLLTSCGTLSSALGKRFGFRLVIMVGSVISCLGYVSSAFVPNMRLLYLTYGILVGFGSGLTFTPTVIMVTMYFDKRRSLANGITVAGSGVGFFLYPFLVNYLIKTYALFGTMIIIGGIVLNSCVGAALQRPIRSPKEGEDITLLTKEVEIDRAKTGRHTHSEKSKRIRCCKVFSKTSCNLTATCKCSYLRDPEFVFYVIAFSLASMSFSSSFIVVPAYAVDCGISKDNVALLVSLAGLSDLTGRIFFGWFSDLKFVRRRYVFIVGMCAGGCSAMLAPLATSFIPLAIFTCWYGLFGGSYWALIAVLLADTFGVEKVPHLFGLTQTFISVPCLIAPPVLGWARDGTGSWNLSFRIAGIWMILAGIIVLLQPLAMRLIKKRKITSQNHDGAEETV